MAADNFDVNSIVANGDDKLLEEFDKFPLHEQIGEITKIIEKVIVNLKPLVVSKLAERNEKNVIENQLLYSVKCLNLLKSDVISLNSSPEMYKLNKVIKVLKECSETIKDNAVAIINTGELFSPEKNQEILKTLSEMNKIVKQLKENESVITMGEKGLITMLEGYKAACAGKLTQTTEEIDFFIKETKNSLIGAKKRINDEFGSTINIIRSHSIKFTMLVSSGMLVLGICLGISFFLGRHINNLITQEAELTKSIQDKENYANILAGVKFYKDKDMFYILFDKNLQTKNFITKDGEQAIGYAR